MFERLIAINDLVGPEVRRIIFRYDQSKEQMYSLLFETEDDYIFIDGNTLAAFSRLRAIQASYQHGFAAMFMQFEKLLKNTRAAEIRMLALWLEDGKLKIYIDRSNEADHIFHLAGIGDVSNLIHHPLRSLIEYYEGFDLSELLFVQATEVYDKFTLYDAGIESFIYRDTLLQYATATKSVSDLLQEFDQEEFLQLNRVQLQWAMDMAMRISEEHGYAGEINIVDKTGYAETFAKKVFYKNSLAFYVDLFIAHNQVAYFQQGNKKIAYTTFATNLQYLGVNLEVEESLQLAEAQIMFVDGQITSEQFHRIIFYILYTFSR